MTSSGYYEIIINDGFTISKKFYYPVSKVNEVFLEKLQSKKTYHVVYSKALYYAIREQWMSDRSLGYWEGYHKPNYIYFDKAFIEEESDYYEEIKPVKIFKIDSMFCKYQDVRLIF